MTLSEEGGNTTQDTLLDGRVQLLQAKDGYRVAADPVLLAAAVELPAKARARARVLDAGCGTGAALFCLLSRLPGVQGVGLDQDFGAIECAQAGIGLNNLVARAAVFAGDLAHPPEGIAPPFDAVMTNPPFYEAGAVPPHPRNATSHALTELTLQTWVKACLALLKPDGVFAIIHRAERISDIIQTLKGCGATVVIPLWPKANQPAKRVIITTRKGRKSSSIIHPGLTLHMPDGSYTAEANAILRDGMPIETRV